jgi:hypothetical protein
VTVHAAVGEDTDRRSDDDRTEDIGLVVHVDVCLRMNLALSERRGRLGSKILGD